MKNRSPLCLLAVTTLLLVGPGGAANWPQLRDPATDGSAVGGDLPQQWSEPENIRWKTRIHDSGHSSPVVWGEQVWVTTATEDGSRLFAVCCDRTTGRTVDDVEVYCFDQRGKTTVMAPGASAKPLAVNQLDEGCFASPAAVDGSLFLRGKTHLYRIGN